MVRDRPHFCQAHSLAPVWAPRSLTRVWAPRSPNLTAGQQIGFICMVRGCLTAATVTSIASASASTFPGLQKARVLGGPVRGCSSAPRYARSRRGGSRRSGKMVRADQHARVAPLLCPARVLSPTLAVRPMSPGVTSRNGCPGMKLHAAERTYAVCLQHGCNGRCMTQGMQCRPGLC